ncbi:hypothetical protein [Leptospira kirschneri]|uniref:hypothetical protein n=1 Tax=Leptospira kirschneri TaxID=29507 RepID=UPI00046C6265|nr:hypothetical protein [Leptospira kirschneri]
MASKKDKNQNLQKGKVIRNEDRIKRKPGASYKATRVEIYKRLKKIEELILAGNESGIVDYCAERFKINRSQALKYKSTALKQIIKSTERDREHNIAKALQMAQLGYSKTIESEKSANAAAKFLDIFCRLSGAYSSIRIDHTSNEKELQTGVVVYIPHDGRDSNDN